MFIVFIFFMCIIPVILIPHFSRKFQDNINKWFPNHYYIENQRSIQEPGKPTDVYIYSKPVDIFTARFIAIRYALSSKSLAVCLIFSFICFIPQFLIMALYLIILGHGFRDIHLFIVGSCDYFIYFCCIIAMISSHIAGIEKTIESMKYNSYTNQLRSKSDPKREQAKEQIKDLMLEVMIARESPAHRLKGNDK